MKNVHGVMASVWMKPEAEAIADRVAKRFARLNNIPVTHIKGRDIGRQYLSHSHFARYHMWNILPKDVERIIYIDADVIPMAPLPELPEGDLCAVSESDGLVKQMMHWWPLIKKAGIYFNSGVFVATRKTEQLFESVLDRQRHAGDGKWPWLYDQTILNVETQIAVKRGELTFTQLPKQWNGQLARDPEIVKKPYLLHFAGMATNDVGKFRVVGAILDRLEEVGA